MTPGPAEAARHQPRGAATPAGARARRGADDPGRQRPDVRPSGPPPSGGGVTGRRRQRAIVEQICRRLEGVPLAIELAAARTKLLSPEAILDRLDHRLDFLVGGARDLPERQQALRRTIEWSYDLLDDAERNAVRVPRDLRRQLLAVGGRGRRAGDVPPAGDRDVLDLLALARRQEPASGWRRPRGAPVPDARA